VRFFRIPAFTGIETHRDDADRGSLRVVEGCLPHGPGGLRSGPVWKDAGSVELVSVDEENQLTASDDGKGNSMLFVSRLDEVHDIAIISTENTEVSIFSTTYPVVDPVDLYEDRNAVLTPVGNRLFSFGDGDGEAVFVGKGPPAVEDTKVFPDARLYSLEYSRFPNCQFFVQGPKKTLFGAGNPKRPLTVYISEPAGKTKAYRDSPYSTEEPTGDAYAGQLSTVDILMSNATRITALSSRGDQVVVHTDKGCHILYAPTGDQANTGYRVEQVAATNFSAAVNIQVVAGEAGSMSFWLGHDGQIYKDESASRGAEDAKSFTDPDQASWKSKGLWEKELPVDLSDSFSAYDRESGMYWLFVRSDEYDKASENDIPGRVTHVEALPDLPGEVTLLTAAPDIPEQVDLTALPDLPGAVENFEITVPPGEVEDFTALPDLPGVVESLTLLTAPGEASDLTAVPGLPGAVTLTALPDDPGTVESLAAIADVPGSPDLTAEPDLPGACSGLEALPDIPGQVTGLELLTKPGSSTNLEAEPDVPAGGSTFNLTALPDLSGPISGLTALPDVPGVVTGLEQEVPEIQLSQPAVMGQPVGLVPNSDGTVTVSLVSLDGNAGKADGTNKIYYEIATDSSFVNTVIVDSGYRNTQVFNTGALAASTRHYMIIKHVGYCREIGGGSGPCYIDSEWSLMYVFDMPANQPVPGQVTGLTAQGTSLNYDQFYWAWDSFTNSLEDYDGDPFNLNNTLFITKIASSGWNAASKFNGFHTSGGPFPNTASIALSYGSTHANKPHVLWGTNPSQKPYSGGKSVAWNYSTSVGQKYHMFQAMAPGPLSSDGVTREYYAEHTGITTSGSPTSTDEYRVFRHTDGLIYVDHIRGSTLIFRYTKDTSYGSPNHYTGRYFHSNTGVGQIWIGLNPQTSGSSQITFTLQDGTNKVVNRTDFGT